MLNLKLNTYFLSLNYFDQICSIFASSIKDHLSLISDICIILAAKIIERKEKAIQTKLYLLGRTNSEKYIKDEEYRIAFGDINAFLNSADDGVYRFAVSFIINGRYIDNTYERSEWIYPFDVEVKKGNGTGV